MHQVADLLRQDLLFSSQPGVGHGLVAGSVGPHLRPVQRHFAQRDHARSPAQFQRLEEHIAQRGQVALSEPADGAEIGGLLGGQPAERDHIGAGPLQLPGGPDPDAVAVQHDPQHQPRVIGRLALGLGVGGVEPVQVQFRVNDLGDEPGQMVLRQPLIQRRRHQHHRIRLERFEALPDPAVDIHRHIRSRIEMLYKGLIEQAKRIRTHAPDSPSPHHKGPG